MTDQEKPGPTRAERFGRFTSQAARDAGYDIDGQRAGGRKKLAEDAGMGQTAVGRMLSGLSVPDPRHFEDLARALKQPLRQLLIEAELISEGALDAAAVAAPPAVPTPEEAARQLGITIPRNIQLFVTMVENMQEQEERPKGKKKGAA